MDYIYALKDGESVFYIGKTNNIKKRKVSHLSESFLNKTEKDKKIQSIISEGRMFDVQVLKTCNPLDTFKEEQAAIKFYSYNNKLFNICHNTKINLSEIETSVLALMADDKETIEIANILYRSPRTIETVRQKLKQKSDTNTISGLIMWAVRNDLVSI